MWPFRRAELKVLMVCTANVCRSPAAEAWLRYQLRQRGFHRRISVASAGTDVGSPGRSPDPRMVALGAEVGISLRGIRATPVTSKMLAASDVVWVMESVHQDVLRTRYPEFEARLALLDPGGAEVPDPYFGDKAGVRIVFEQLGELIHQRMSLLEGLLTAVRDLPHN